jgi:diguanylate cyclase (GGDEF)-like protein
MAKLVVADRNSCLRVFPLGSKSITLGREPENELQIDGLDVSRQHCRIEPLPKGGYQIIDLESANGTFLNGRQITTMALEYDDLLRLGDAMLIYIDDATDPERALNGADFGAGVIDSASEEADNRLNDDSEEIDSRRRTKRLNLEGPDSLTSNRSYLKERLLRLGVLTQNIASAPDLRGLIETILDEVLDFTGFERGLLLLSDELRSDSDGGAHMNPVLGRNMDHEHLDDIERRCSKELVEEALTKKRITFRAGLANSDDSSSIRESVVSMGLETALCIPLTVRKRLTVRPGKKDNKDDRCRRKSRNRVLGAIYLDSTSPIRPLDKADLKLLEMVAAQAAVALHNARLHHQATTDPLTGLHNRSAIRQVFEEELRLARESEEPLAVLLLDVDHFKRINDLYGHNVGDEVLKRAAQRIRRSIRRDDFAARWGGDEFLVLLRQTTLEDALVLARGLGEAIRKQPFTAAQEAVSVSIGVSAFPLHADSQKEIVRCADLAMYAAKAEGRDQIRAFSPEVVTLDHQVDPLEALFDCNTPRTLQILKTIHGAIEVLHSTAAPEAIIADVLDRVRELTRARRVVLLVDHGDGNPAAVARSGDTQSEFPGTLGEATREAISRALPTVLANAVVVPLVVMNELFGALYADQPTTGHDFDTIDLKASELIAHQFTLALGSSPRLFSAASGRVLGAHLSQVARQEFATQFPASVCDRMMDTMKSELRSLQCLRFERWDIGATEFGTSLVRAQDLAREDPDMALAKCRKVLEAFAYRLFEDRLGDPGSRNLEKLLHLLGKDHLPRKIAVLCGVVQRLGYTGAHPMHDDEKITEWEANLAIDAMALILEWLAREAKLKGEEEDRSS